MEERRPIVHPLSHVPVIYPALFYDDGNGADNWITSADGADFDASYQSVAAYVGAKGLRLATRATGPTTGDVVTVSHYIPSTPNNLLRVRVHFCQRDATPDGFFYVFPYWFDGTNFYAPEICFDTSDQKVYYATTLRAGYVDSGLEFSEINLSWTLLDFSIDLNTHTYKTLRVNNRIVDLSAIPIAANANATKPSIRLYIEVATAANAQIAYYVDQILVTAENP